MLSLQNDSVFCSGHMEPSEMGIFLNKSWTPQLRDQTLCFFAWDRFFPAAATQGWEWCNHNAGLPECTAALRDLKLLVGSGDLDFTKGMDSLDKHVWKISFRQCITLCEHGQLKGWRKPHFQLAVAKSWISLIAIAWQMWKNALQYSVTNLGDHNSVTKPMLLHMTHKSGVFHKGMGSFPSIMQA